MNDGDNNNERSFNTQEEHEQEHGTRATQKTATTTRPTTTELEHERRRMKKMKNMKHETPLSGTAKIAQQRSSLAILARRKLRINL
jgi:hypothetical protein